MMQREIMSEKRYNLLSTRTGRAPIAREFAQDRAKAALPEVIGEDEIQRLVEQGRWQWIQLRDASPGGVILCRE
jgi:hypothetical protein